MSLVLKYSEELQKDMHIDELNVTQVAYSLPAIKHKWVARLIDAKIKIKDLDKKKKDVKELFLKKLKNDPSSVHLKLSSLSIERSLDNNEQYKSILSEIDNSIEDTKLVIMYLEKVENIFKNMTFDIKNIVDLSKLETT
jgi:hypothetical protein